MKIGICIAVLICNIFTLFSNQHEGEKLSEIYYSKNLNNTQKRDSIINTFFNDSIPVKQLFYADQLIRMAERHNDYPWVYRGYYFKGNACIYLAEPDKAYKAYLQSLEALKKGGIREGIGDIYIGIGNSFSMSDDPEKAIEYYNKAFAAYEAVKDTTYSGLVLLSIINEYHNTNNLDSIRHYLHRAGTFFGENVKPSVKAYLCGYRAMFYAKTNRNKEALTEFEKSKKLFYEGGRIYNIVSFEIEMSKILLKTEKLNSAKEFALECYHEAYRAGLKEQIRDASALLSDINRKLGNFEEALHYQTSYINYKDSIKNEEIIRKMADLRTEYEISQKQMVIDLLEKKRSVTRAALITVLAILIVVFILAYLLHSNNKLVKNQRRKLIRQKSDLQDINKAKDKMFSIISHDLRGPIHSIAGLSSMLKELVINEETGELLELTDHMNNSLENISFLLDNLLEWASNQQGYLVYNPGRFRLRDVFESLKEIFSNTARAKGVEIILEIDPKSEICTDKNFFSTIFRNLIGNAVKYTKAGDSITITCDNIPGRIRISVADTGVGIPKEKIPNLFELSDRNSTWGTANEKGIGLGLQLVHEFTLMSNGEIFVESEVGKGTTFQVVFPADLVAC